MLTLISILSMSGLCLFFALVLVVANKQLRVEEDPKIEEIAELLPNANCGACGYAGCHNYAEKVVEEGVLVSPCPVGGSETASRIAAILGIEYEDVEPNYAFVHCGANCTQKSYKADYFGVEDCEAALVVAGGNTTCGYACLGFGNCVRVCPFDAITIVDGLPKIDYDRCTGCGNCVKACPRKIISLAPLSNERNYCIACSSHDKGGTVRKICPVGCIGCRLCEKNCPEQAIRMEDNLAIIDYAKCNGDGVCAEKCPQGTIVNIESLSRELADVEA